MYLGGRALRKLLIEGNWTARIKELGQPLREMKHSEVEALIGPNSIDVTLGDVFKIPSVSGKVVLDPTSPSVNKDLCWTRTEGPLILQPQGFALGSVRESFNCNTPFKGDHYAQMYDGRSTMGRIGIGSHVTAGFGDFGFCGAFTLEIVNHAPYSVLLTPGMRIGQVYFVKVRSPFRYKGAYRMDEHATEPVEPVLGPDRF